MYPATFSNDLLTNNSTYIILKIFISHVRGVEGYVHNIHTFNGKHVEGVESLFDLHHEF